VYTLRLRGLRDPMMEVFNQPSPDLSCERRDASTVTPQVFSLFNSEVSYDRAVALANRVVKEVGAKDRGAAVERIFKLVYGRAPTANEREECVKHWAKMEERHRGLTFARSDSPKQITREAVEENTGEKFTFNEPLEAAADFVPDLKPADVDAVTRGLAEVCLVLMNGNEFVYVY
jgi:hypothetical protein